MSKNISGSSPRHGHAPKIFPGLHPDGGEAGFIAGFLATLFLRNPGVDLKSWGRPCNQCRKATDTRTCEGNLENNIDTFKTAMI